ncbi:MAG: MFS transporter [Candidatus Pacebacteria bacterium]|nr:MFS transporter [Candidatus Paceibacterota bacterium]
MKINHVIRSLVLGDFFINAGFSLFAPVFAIFVTRQISNGNLEVLGFSAAIVQIFKVVFEIPVAAYLDRNHGEYDDFYAMIFGALLTAIIPFMYLIATTPNHLYIISAIYGIGIAFTVPPWSAIFSRHLDQGHENIDYSLESVAIGIAAAGAAALSGILSQHFGFSVVFLIAGVLAIFGASQQIKIYSDIRSKVSRGVVKPDIKGSI